MTKPTLLLVVCLCAQIVHGQKTDTLVLLYKPDQFNIATELQHKLDIFLAQGWDRISITGYTDETDEEDYNLELSRKRSAEVYQYLMAKGMTPQGLSYQ